MSCDQCGQAIEQGEKAVYYEAGEESKTFCSHSCRNRYLNEG